MSSRRGNDMGETAIFTADSSAKIDPTKDLTDDESKEKFLKRMKREEAAHRKGQKVVDEWYEVVNGKKLVKKLKKNNGGVYSIYICNIKKPANKEIMALLTKGTDGRYRRKGEVSKAAKA